MIGNKCFTFFQFFLRNEVLSSKSRGLIISDIINHPSGRVGCLSPIRLSAELQIYGAHKSQKYTGVYMINLVILVYTHIHINVVQSLTTADI